MDKEHNEIGKDIVGGSKSKPKVLAEILKKMNWRSRKMNRPYEKLHMHFLR
jgi:hypothetical protein